MPLYDFKCTNPDCGFILKDQMWSAAAAKAIEAHLPCPQCRKGKMKKMVPTHTSFRMSGGK